MLYYNFNPQILQEFMRNIQNVVENMLEDIVNSSNPLLFTMYECVDMTVGFKI